MISFVRILLGIVYFVLFVYSMPWFFNIPLKGDEGFLGFYGAVAVNVILTMSLLLLSIGFLAKKRWAVVLCLIYCGLWVSLFSLPLFLPGSWEPKNLVQFAEYLVLFVGPLVLGLFLWRHLDHFEPGILPCSWHQWFRAKNGSQGPSEP